MNTFGGGGKRPALSWSYPCVMACDSGEVRKRTPLVVEVSKGTSSVVQVTQRTPLAVEVEKTNTLSGGGN